MTVLSGVQLALSVAIAAVVGWLVVWRFGRAGMKKALAARAAVGRLCSRLCGGGRRRGGGGGGGHDSDGRVAPESPAAGPSSPGFSEHLASKGVGGGMGGSWLFGGGKQRLGADAPLPPPPPPAPLASAGGSGGSGAIPLRAGSGGSGASGASGSTPRASAGGTTPHRSGLPLPPPPFAGGTAATTPRESGTPRGY